MHINSRKTRILIPKRMCKDSKTTAHTRTHRRGEREEEGEGRRGEGRGEGGGERGEGRGERAGGREGGGGEWQVE